ncbi:LysR substrate-binding domain-containing protein [Roseomonas sp. KE2513]|uniref:LysR substrate-binding domain-containing protein n=1 Tax=Roseomonas sp. KE2513 TaxID=2479202 RepID=UPI0018E0556E|nr:LysR substrate-binding domain-containing protein [Roseomonas sp. KE2513]
MDAAMPHAMSQRALQAFQLTVLTGSVSAAAEAMGRSQPAATRLLKELEENLGFHLFDRVRGRLQPTPEGLLLFQEVERSLIGLDRIAAVAAQIRKGRRGTLTLGVLPAATGILTPVMKRFTEERPGTAISLHAVPSEQVVQMVLKQECHLGLVSDATPLAGLRVERRYALGCLCIMPPGHALGGKTIVTPQDLDGERLVALSPATRIGRQLEAVLEQNGIAPLIQVETHLSHVVSDLVLAGTGIGLVDAVTAAAHVARGGLSRPFSPAVGFGLVAVRAAETERPGAVAAFLALCDARFAPLVPAHQEKT